jgi:hypothetical protein
MALVEKTRQADNERRQYMAKFEAERLWFEVRRERIMHEHPDAKYVAIYRGMPVIVGGSDSEVAKAFLEAFGPQPVYIGSLSTEARPAVFSSPVAR